MQQTRIGTSNPKTTLESKFASVPLIPKFARQRAARACELRNRDTSAVSCKSLARKRCALAERFELAERDIPPHRRHAAIGAGDDAFLGQVFCRFADDRGHLVRALDLLARDVDSANLHVLAVEQLQQGDRNTGISAFDRNLTDSALGQRRENLLVLPPFAAERCLPVDIGLDAVAVADVNGGGA